MYAPLPKLPHSRPSSPSARALGACLHAGVGSRKPGGVVDGLCLVAGQEKPRPPKCNGMRRAVSDWQVFHPTTRTLEPRSATLSPRELRAQSNPETLARRAFEIVLAVVNVCAKHGLLLARRATRKSCRDCARNTTGPNLSSGRVGVRSTEVARRSHGGGGGGGRQKRPPSLDRALRSPLAPSHNVSALWSGVCSILPHARTRERPDAARPVPDMRHPSSADATGALKREYARCVANYASWRIEAVQTLQHVSLASTCTRSYEAQQKPISGGAQLHVPALVRPVRELATPVAHVQRQRPWTDCVTALVRISMPRPS